MTGWIQYLKTVALGGSLPAIQAKLLLNLGHDIDDTPSDTRKKIGIAVRAGRIDKAGLILWQGAVDDLRLMWRRGVQTHKIDTSNTDWAALPTGGHVRLPHLDDVRDWRNDEA